MISSIELRTFKCFELLRLPLSPLTLLTGLNASGKSSVLQALVLLHQTMRDHEWSTRLVLNGSALRLGAMPDVVDKISGRNNLGIALEENDSNTYAWTFGGGRRDMSLEVLNVRVNNQTVESPSELRYLLPPNDRDSVTSLTRSLLDLTYITAERIPPQEAYDLQDPHIVSSVGPRGEHAVSLLHWERDELVSEELALAGSPIMLRQIVARMGQFFPGFNLDLQQAQGASAISLGLLTSEATGFHSPIHTGFGLTQVLPIVIAVLSASKSDIILIENPEVHLHPAGQALIGQFIADAVRAGIQIIVETHSDHVLNGVRRAVKDGRIASDQVCIHFFRPRSNDGSPQVISPILDETGNIDDWPDGFFDQFDKDSNYFAGWMED